ncbi:hypothetical protein ACROYT_G005435 [Oculina patagonica]
MFRLFFVLALAFFLSSFAISQNKSANETNETGVNQNNCAFASQVGCGKDGKDGKDGQNGKDGRDGLNGKDGRDGRDGTRGPKGEKGETGTRELDENAGIKGQKGEPGLKGKDGNFSANGSSRMCGCGAKCKAIHTDTCCLQKLSNVQD